MAANGHREVLGVDVGDSKDEAFWTAFLAQPKGRSRLRLVGAVLLETHDEWQVADRAYFSDQSMAQLNQLRDDDPNQGGDHRPQHALPAAQRAAIAESHRHFHHIAERARFQAALVALGI